MKTVIADTPQFLLDWRRKTGADRYDEMWDGVLHMSPAPSLSHQDFVVECASWLLVHWAAPCRGKVYSQANVASPGSWPHNYRIPDIILLTPARFGIRRDEHFDGGPDVVIEVRSPGDESYEKMDFYAEVGAAELWIVDRDTKKPQVFQNTDGSWVERQLDEGGWAVSPLTDVRMRGTVSQRLELTLGENANSWAEIPQW
jgi:Uma2 family endonuclease